MTKFKETKRNEIKKYKTEYSESKNMIVLKNINTNVNFSHTKHLGWNRF